LVIDVTTGVIDSSHANVQSPEQIDGIPLMATDTFEIKKKIYNLKIN
jgi:hypothetical protein